MGRAIQILAVLWLLTLASVVTAQTPATCGIVGIDGPGKVESNTPLVLKVRVAGMLHTTKPEFKWKVSAGEITQGQGSDEITVDTVGIGGQLVTVTVELVGAALGCNGSAFTTAKIEPPVICRCVFDEYGNIEFEDEKARLDNFAIQLSELPLFSGYILMSAGQETYKNETTEHLDRVKSYLVNVRDIDAIRVVTLDCGFTKDLTIKLWVVPPGKTLECLNPPELQLPLSEIKFTKPRPKAAKKRR